MFDVFVEAAWSSESVQRIEFGQRNASRMILSLGGACGISDNTETVRSIGVISAKEDITYLQKSN